MTSDEVLEIFKKTGGYITSSHIVLTSGKHSDTYLNKDAIYPHTEEISSLCFEIAKRCKDKEIEVVAAPALGGIILSQWTAYHLTQLKGKEILGIFTEKTLYKNQILTRGYDKLVKNKNVLVIEDVTNTGGSVLKVINSIKGAGGKIMAVSVLVNRDPDGITSETFSTTFFPLAQIKVPSWEENDCQLCRKGVPINIAVGKGSEYLAKKSK